MCMHRDRERERENACSYHKANGAKYKLLMNLDKGKRRVFSTILATMLVILSK